MLAIIISIAITILRITELTINSHQRTEGIIIIISIINIIIIIIIIIIRSSFGSRLKLGKLSRNLVSEAYASLCMVSCRCHSDAGCDLRARGGAKGQDLHRVWGLASMEGLARQLRGARGKR